MKISLFIIVDYLFKFILIFLLNFVWCLYFFKQTPISIIIAIISTILIIFISNKITIKRNNKSKISFAEKQKIENITNTFIYMSQDEILEFFYKLTNTKHTAKLTDNFVVIENENKKIVLYPYFKNEALNSDKLIEIYNNCKILNANKLIVLSNKFLPDTQKVIDNLNFEILLLNNQQTYTLLLKEYEFYPEIKIQLKVSPKKTFKQILNYALNKKRTKSYIISALFLLFSSLFIQYKIYYLIIASVLLTLSIFSRFNTNFNKVNKLNVLD